MKLEEISALLRYTHSNGGTDDNFEIELASHLKASLTCSRPPHLATSVSLAPAEPAWEHRVGAVVYNVRIKNFKQRFHSASMT